MSNYYYSKFDNINWSWWEEKEIPSAIKDTLETVNRQLKCYFPAKYLLFIPAEQYFILLSERNQVDRDNAGRIFSFRHFMVVDKEELQDFNSFQNILCQFKEPIDYRHPDGEKQQPAAAPVADGSVTFDLLWEALQNGSKLCLVNEAIDTHSQTDKQFINGMVFANFPEVQELVQAIAVLPAPVINKTAFCLNYENGFIDAASSKLAMIDLVYCGNKSMVEEGFDVNHNIDMQALISHGFVIKKIGEQTFDNLKWQKLHTYLSQQKGANSEFNQVAGAWANQQPGASTRQAVIFCTNLFYLFNKGPATGPDDGFIDTVLDLKELDAGIKRKIFISQFEYATGKDIADNLFRYAQQAARTGLSKAFDEQVVSAMPFHEFKATQFAEWMTDNRFQALSVGIQYKFAEQFGRYQFTPEEFLSGEIFSIIQQYGKKEPFNLKYIWQELKNARYNTISNQHIDKLKFLYELTNSHTEYKQLLESKFNQNFDRAWLQAAQESDLKINITSPPPVNTLSQFLDWFEIYETDDDKPGKKSLPLIKDQLVSFIHGNNNLVELSYMYSSMLSRSLHTSKRFTPLLDKIKEKVEILLPQLLVSNSDQFPYDLKTVCGHSHGIELLTESQKKLVKVHPVNFGNRFLLNFMTLTAMTNLDEKPQIKYINNLFEKSIYQGPGNDYVEKNTRKELSKRISQLSDPRLLPKTLLDNLQPAGFTLTGFLKNNRMLILLFTVITVALVTMVYIFDNPDGAILLPDTTQPTSAVNNKPPETIDSNALALAEASKLLNTTIFHNPPDTPDFFGFRQKMKNIDFIAFGFESVNFKKYAVRKLDSISDNPLWNRFVAMYNDTTLQHIQINLVHVHNNKDSFSRVSGIIIKN